MASPECVADDLRDEFLCSICHELLKSPVITNCGHSFCAQCLADHLARLVERKQEKTCPVCRNACDAGVPNIFARHAVDSVQVRCKHHLLGCAWCGRYDGLMKHLELECEFAQDVHCPHADIGCPYVGTRECVRGHARVCHFNEMRDVVEAVMRRIGPLHELLGEVQRLRGELDHALRQVRELNLTSVCSGYQSRSVRNFGIDLEGCHFPVGRGLSVSLSGANLRGAVLRKVRAGESRFVDFSGADLRDADLRDAYLPKADLRGADLRGADLRNACLDGALLRGAKFQNADLRGARQLETTLDANFEGAILK